MGASLSAPITRRDVALIAGRYRIETELGAGGAAQLLRVVDVTTGRKLALKRMRASAPERLKVLFELEYQTLASIRHPRVVEVFEYGRDEHGAFYTMELLTGSDLSENPAIDYREACALLRDAAYALSLLHARKLVHRDVSPRNLWRTPDGRVKLIDFGALAPFGPVDHVMGTPPCLAPEAFEGQPIDARADLYALGAVAYYLLSGMHAYPARTLRELPIAWERPLPPPSSALPAALRAELPPIPAELDQLVLSLLSRDVLARPRSAAEVIDLLEGLTGAAPSSEREPGLVQLPRPAFVGRRRERRTLMRQVQLARRGRGQSTFVVGESGVGRTRLLQELGLWARIAPASVVHVQAEDAPGFYGVAAALCTRLLDTLPDRAAALAAPHAALLAHLSPRLAERLGSTPLALPEGFGELRVRVQLAFRDLVLAVAAEQTLVVVVDDVDRADEGSLACLIALAHATKGARLLVACSAAALREEQTSAPIAALRRASHRLGLGPLEDGEMLDLLHSMFGEAEHLARLTARLQRTTLGNPGYALELCEQLVQRDLIVWTSGSWVLPRDLPDALFSVTREQARSERLALLSPEARELARVLAVRAGLTPLELCRALGDCVSVGSLKHLNELSVEGVVVRTTEGVRFAHEQLRRLLASELSPALCGRAHRTIASALLTGSDVSTLSQLEAGVHLLESGDEAGSALTARAALRIATAEGGKIVSALSSLERAFVLFEARKRPPHELVMVLAPLAMAGYYVDRQYALRYGERTLAILEDLSGLSHARKLASVVGKKPALLLGVSAAKARAGLRERREVAPSYREIQLALFACVATLTASSGVCIDPDNAERFACTLEPYAALGKRHIAGFMHAFCMGTVLLCRDRPGAGYRHWRELVELLEQGKVQGITPALLPRYLAGALYSLGIAACQRDGGEALSIADRLEAIGGYHARMSADQIRVLYHGHQGDEKRFEEHRARIEQHAIQQGAMWQIEAWLPPASSAIYTRAHDAMAMKRTSEQVQRLAQRIPSLDLHGRNCRGVYLTLRKRYVEALPWLEDCLRKPPRSHVAWSRMVGTLARAYNGLNDHARAKKVCLDALSRTEPDDLTFTGLYLNVQLELLFADAALGNVKEALVALDALIAQHAPNEGALTMGEIHDMGVQIGLHVGDLERAEQHLEALSHWYGRTGMPSLIARRDELSMRLALARRGPDGDPSRPGLDHATESLTDGQNSASMTIARLLTGHRLTLPERAHKALQILVENTRARDGYLYLLDADEQPRLCASLKERPASEELDAWVAARVLSEQNDAATQLDDGEFTEQTAHGSDVRSDGYQHYRLLPLWSVGEQGATLVGVALVGAPDEPPAYCPVEVLGTVSHHLRRALDRSADSEFSP